MPDRQCTYCRHQLTASEQYRRTVFARRQMRLQLALFQYAELTVDLQVQQVPCVITAHPSSPGSQLQAVHADAAWRGPDATCAASRPSRIGDRCAAHTFPTIEVRHPTAHVEHEATTSRIGEDQLFYAMQRGISAEDAVSMIVNGFCREVFKELPMEFAVEAQKLLAVSLEGSVG